MGNILVYNSSFFQVSQTFVYHQIEALSEYFGMDLLSYKFQNPHDFDIRKYRKYRISRPERFLDRVGSKLYRMTTDSSLHIDLQSHMLLRNIFNNREYEAIHAHFGYNGLNILQYAKSNQIPLVVTFHGHDASSMLRDKEYKSQLTELFDYASSIILVSSHMVDMLKIEPWIDKVKIIPCSVDPDEFKSSKPQVSNDKIKILHAGRITPKKGVPDLIKVFKELNYQFENLELHIVGDGEELKKCKELVEEHCLGKQVVFYGAVQHKRLKSILNSCDIFVLNSRVAEDGDMEGTPVTLLEAMSLRKPVVSTYHAGIPYVIEDGLNGLLVEESENDQLKKSLSELITNKNLRSLLGNEARKTIVESYSIRNMKQQVQSVFTKITDTEFPPLRDNSLKLDDSLKFQKREIA